MVLVRVDNIYMHFIQYCIYFTSIVDKLDTVTPSICSLGVVNHVSLFSSCHLLWYFVGTSHPLYWESVMTLVCLSRPVSTSILVTTCIAGFVVLPLVWRLQLSKARMVHLLGSLGTTLSERLGKVNRPTKLTWKGEWVSYMNRSRKLNLSSGQTLRAWYCVCVFDAYYWISGYQPRDSFYTYIRAVLFLFLTSQLVNRILLILSCLLWMILGWKVLWNVSLEPRAWWVERVQETDRTR